MLKSDIWDTFTFVLRWWLSIRCTLHASVCVWVHVYVSLCVHVCMHISVYTFAVSHTETLSFMIDFVKTK